jgi:hypothetical protein
MASNEPARKEGKLAHTPAPPDDDAPESVAGEEDPEASLDVVVNAPAPQAVPGKPVMPPKPD